MTLDDINIALAEIDDLQAEWLDILKKADEEFTEGFLRIAGGSRKSIRSEDVSFLPPARKPKVD